MRAASRALNPDPLGGQKKTSLQKKKNRCSWCPATTLRSFGLRSRATNIVVRRFGGEGESGETEERTRGGRELLESVDQFRFFFFFSSSILMPLFRCCSSYLAQFSPPPPKHSTHSFTVTTASSCELASLELVAGNAFDVVMCEVRQDEGEDRDEFTSNKDKAGRGAATVFPRSSSIPPSLP